MCGIHPSRVFASGGTGPASPYVLALAALLLASSFLLALIAFSVFLLLISSPTIPSIGAETESSGGGEATSELSRLARKPRPPRP
ncbi:putative prolyl 4-hydroxylase 3 [Hordeum vulgare]|nr:putative prolyl 4-hydroxylase 3 [Hordeum vulgare]